MDEQKGIKYVALVVCCGIDESITQKDWLDIWEKIRNIRRISGVKTANIKRERKRFYCVT